MTGQPDQTSNPTPTEHQQCQGCGGYGEVAWLTTSGYDSAICEECGGIGVTTFVIKIMAPTIKPVTKRKTKKVYQRNPMLNANDRDHWRVTRPITAEWRERGNLAATGLQVHRLGIQHATINAYIHRPSLIKSDAGNFYPTVKPIIDGMVEAGLLPDDNDDHLSGPFLHKGTKGPYAVTITITPTINP